MTDWFEPFTRLTPPSDDVMWSRCRVHSRYLKHATIQMGTLRGLPMPRMTVYQWMQYGGENLDWWQEYCPGQDVVSRSISTDGIWEPTETVLFIDILKQGTGEGVVLDYGCQLGWYTAIATHLGYRVAAIDVNRENWELTQTNAQPGFAEVFLGAVDESTPLFNPEVHVRIAKIDIEGAERWAVRMLAPVLEARNVHYLLMEVSPVFNDTYPDLVEQVAGYGYDVYMVPANRLDLPVHYGEHPLTSILTAYRIPADGRRRMIAGLHQADLLFARRP